MKKLKLFFNLISMLLHSYLTFFKKNKKIKLLNISFSQNFLKMFNFIQSCTKAAKHKTTEISDTTSLNTISFSDFSSIEATTN